MSRNHQAAGIAALSALSICAGAGVAVLLSSGPASAETGTHIRIEEALRTVTLKAGGQYTLSSACAPGEAVTGGGPTKLTPGLAYPITSPFFDGVGSGWSVTCKNVKSTALTVQLGTSALCVTPGYMTPSGNDQAIDQ